MTDRVYSATYSNVPVYEYNVEGNHAMRRRADDWINATHILKVADYDKPARTRILEREVQKGVHEKVQGGYGKYQGTWIPLPDGRILAERNGVLEKMRPIFDFVPGDKTPPPAPKHATAASGKPRASRAPARRPIPPFVPPPNYDQPDVSMVGARAVTPDDETIATESMYDGYDNYPPTSARKRRRIMEDPQVQADNMHQLWADELLDYFILQGTSPDVPAPSSAPAPPEGADLDRAIDDKGHTALHWAAAMADLDVIKSLIRDGASIDIPSKNGETPLMRSVMFTNVYEKQNMERIAAALIRTVNMQEWSGSTVFHYIANTTVSKKKYQCARYYMDCILNKMAEVLSPDQIERVINETDQNGDTAITIAARNGARKCVRSLIGRNAAVDIPNLAGETADQLIVALNHRRQERTRQLSSSPFQAPHDSLHSLGGAVQPPSAIPFDPLIPHSSLPNADGNDSDNPVFRSEPALNLTAHVMPALYSKMRTLGAALDAELADKDAELAEAERVLRTRQAELDALRARVAEVRAREAAALADAGEAGEGDVADDDALAERVADVEKRAEATVELHQARQLASLLSSPQASAETDAKDSSGGVAALPEQLSLARQILSLKEERHSLVRETVSGLALARLGEGKQREYKRLIRGALGIGEEELEGLLPEIVEELEMGRGIGGIGG